MTDTEKRIKEILEVRQKLFGGGEDALMCAAVSVIAQMLDSQDGFNVIQEAVWFKIEQDVAESVELQPGFTVSKEIADMLKGDKC